MGCLKEGFVDSGIRECCRGANLVGGWRGRRHMNKVVLSVVCSQTGLAVQNMLCWLIMVLRATTVQSRNKCSLVTKGMKE